MNPDAQITLERHLVESFGLFWEEAGGSRMTGRILGRLMICDPPHQSSAQLADNLVASRGAISQASRILLSAGLIEKVPIHGERATYFRLRPGAFDHTLHAELARLSILSGLADQGLGLLADRPPSQRERLDELKEMVTFFQAELPALIERWDAHRRQRSTE